MELGDATKAMLKEAKTVIFTWRLFLEILPFNSVLNSVPSSTESHPPDYLRYHCLYCMNNFIHMMQYCRSTYIEMTLEFSADIFNDIHDICHF